MTATVDRLAADSPGLSPARARASVAALCFGGLTVSLSQTLVIPIQGELPVLLETTAANAGWVVTATLLAGAIAMPIAGSLGDLFGKQRVLVASALMLLLGSVVVALSDDLLPVLVGRGLQGLAMGFIPVGISMVREVTPPELTATGIAAMSATLGVGGAVGLPLSAWVVQEFDWHIVFWVTAGLAALVAVTTYAVVPHVHDAHGGRFDLPGALGLALGLGLFLAAVSKGNEWGWDTALPWTFGSTGLVVLLLWGWLQLRIRMPLVDLRTTARRPVLLTNVAAVAIGFGMMAQAVVVPQLMVLSTRTGHGLGQTILEAGLWMAPGGLVMMAFTPVSAKLLRTVGPRVTLVVGAVLLGLGYLYAFTFGSEPWQLMIASSIGSAGVGVGYAAMPTLIMLHVPEREAGAAVGLNGLMRSVGTTTASAVMVAILTASTVSFGGLSVPTELAFRICFLVGAAAAFAGAGIGLAIPRQRA
jgi:MFS family permease